MASTTFVAGQTVIEADWLNDVNAVVYGAGGIDASSVTNTPAGNIAATDVQAALNELDAEKQPLDADLTAIAALSTQAFGRSLLTQADAPTARTTLDAQATLVSGTNIKTVGGVSVLGSGDIPVVNGYVISYIGTGGIASKGALVTVASGWGQDNTIPQKTEGVALLNVTISCQVGDVIEIHSEVYIETNVGNSPSIALFVDSEADAIAASQIGLTSNTYAGTCLLTSTFVATATSHTLKIRGGTNTGSWDANTAANNATFGGVIASFVSAKIVG